MREISLEEAQNERFEGIVVYVRRQGVIPDYERADGAVVHPPGSEIPECRPWQDVDLLPVGDFSKMRLERPEEIDTDALVTVSVPYDDRYNIETETWSFHPEIDEEAVKRGTQIRFASERIRVSEYNHYGGHVIAGKHLFADGIEGRIIEKRRDLRDSEERDDGSVVTGWHGDPPSCKFVVQNDEGAKREIRVTYDFAGPFNGTEGRFLFTPPQDAMHLRLGDRIRVDGDRVVMNDRFRDIWGGDRKGTGIPRDFDAVDVTISEQTQRAPVAGGEAIQMADERDIPAPGNDGSPQLDDRARVSIERQDRALDAGVQLRSNPDWAVDAARAAGGTHDAATDRVAEVAAFERSGFSARPEVKIERQEPSIGAARVNEAFARVEKQNSSLTIERQDIASQRAKAVVEKVQVAQPEHSSVTIERQPIVREQPLAERQNPGLTGEQQSRANERAAQALQNVEKSREPAAYVPQRVDFNARIATDHAQQERSNEHSRGGR